MRAALVELNYYHGEILPTLVYILNKLDVGVDVFARKHLIHNNPFIYTHDLRFEQHTGIGFGFNPWFGRKQLENYDLVIANSLEPKQRLQQFADIRTPLIGVLHNGDLLANDPDYAAFFADPSRVPIVLARHVAAYAPGLKETQWIAPVYLGTTTRGETSNDVRVCFCAQGNIEFARRNYDALLEAVKRLTAPDCGQASPQIELDPRSSSPVLSEHRRDFHVLMIGRNTDQDGITLKKRLKESGLDSLFSFSKGELIYRDYYRAISDAAFLLPLVDTTTAQLLRYYRYKLSTSVQLALAFGIVPIIHAELARLYGIEDCSITYENNQLHEALRKALWLDRSSLADMRARLVERREAYLQTSVANVRDLLHSVGLMRPAMTGGRVH